MRKTISLALAVSTAFVLASCGGTDEPVPATQEKNDKQASVSSEAKSVTDDGGFIYQESAPKDDIFAKAEKKRTEAKFAKDEAEKQARSLLTEYVNAIQADKDITKFINQNSINLAFKKTQAFYSKYDAPARKRLFDDMVKLGFSGKSLDLTKMDDFVPYANFIIKYPIKVRGAIASTSFDSFAGDEKEWTMKYAINFADGKSLRLEAHGIGNKLQVDSVE